MATKSNFNIRERTIRATSALNIGNGFILIKFSSPHYLTQYVVIVISSDVTYRWPCIQNCKLCHSWSIGKRTYFGNAHCNFPMRSIRNQVKPLYISIFRSYLISNPQFRPFFYSFFTRVFTQKDGKYSSINKALVVHRIYK